MTFEEVRAFDCNPDNCMNCEHCPHNIGASDWQDRLPCGQFHCWVELITDGNEE